MECFISFLLFTFVVCVYVCVCMCVCEVLENRFVTVLRKRVRKAEGIPIGKPPAGSVEFPARILCPTDAVAAVRDRGSIQTGEVATGVP